MCDIPLSSSPKVATSRYIHLPGDQCGDSQPKIGNNIQMKVGFELNKDESKR